MTLSFVIATRIDYLQAITHLYCAVVLQLVAEDPERFEDADEEEEDDEDGHPNNVPHPTRPEQ